IMVTPFDGFEPLGVQYCLITLLTVERITYFIPLVSDFIKTISINSNANLFGYVYKIITLKGNILS
ncbi:MAG: hypothetical protein RBU23_10905, partial [Candidatus Auribacterota bacterium]|nr:hypothetical protein [Candidatus Auribacterota bacterium]